MGTAITVRSRSGTPSRNSSDGSRVARKPWSPGGDQGDGCVDGRNQAKQRQHPEPSPVHPAASEYGKWDGQERQRQQGPALT